MANANTLPNSRLMRDASTGFTYTTKALPNNTSNTTDYIDLAGTGFNPEEIVVEVSVPAIAGHTTANNLTLTLYHSDSTTGAAVTNPQQTFNILGVNSSGSVATVLRMKLPPGTKRYIAFYQTATTDDCSAATATYTILT